MAAENAPLVVTVKADTKDLDKGLSAAVRAANREVEALKRQISGMSSDAPARVSRQVVAVDDAAKKAAFASKQLSFQINDIVSGLASGQRPAQVLSQQLTQVTQSLQGLGARGTFTALTGALLDPWVAIPALVTIATAAIGSYFSAGSDGAEELNKKLKEERDLLHEVAQAHGDELPELKQIDAELTKREELEKERLSTTQQLSKAQDDLNASLAKVGPSIDTAQKVFGNLALGKGIDFAKLKSDWEIYRAAVAAGTATTADGEKMAAEFNATLGKLPMRTAAGEFDKALPSVNKWIERIQALKGELTDVAAQLRAAALASTDLAAAVTAAGGSLSAALSGGKGIVPLGTQAGLLGDVSDASVKAIKQYEGFITHAKWDKNAFRVGFGSDTFVDQMGNVQKVTKDTVVTLEQADADLARRIPEFQRTITDAIGPDYWRSFSADQQAALTSIAYNYGSLPKSIVKAIQTGDQGQVAAAIRALGSDNAGINKARREGEAQAFGAAPSAPAKASTAFDDLYAKNEQAIEQQQRINAINSDSTATEDEKTAALDRASAAAEQAKIAEQLLAAAKQQGLAITDELKAKIDAQAASMANAGLAADTLKDKQQAAAEEAKKHAAAMAQLGQQLDQMASSAISGFIQDLRNGVSAGDAFRNMINRLIDSLIQLALQSVFNPAGGGGGLISQLLGLGGGFPAAPGGLYDQGGVVRPGGGRHDGRRYPLSLWAGAPSMARGGVLPGGGIPIIAHPGELVIPKRLLGRGRAGSGGHVDNRTQVGDVAVHVEAKADQVASTTAQGAALGLKLSDAVKIVLVQESRPGGILRKQPR